MTMTDFRWCMLLGIVLFLSRLPAIAEDSAMYTPAERAKARMAEINSKPLHPELIRVRTVTMPTVEMLMDNTSHTHLEKPMVSLERESLIEIGNILIGACIGKISELLDTFATYSPPRLINDITNGYDPHMESYDPSHKAILMKTLFKFEQKDLTGLLLILTSQESIGWLKRALLAFMEQYE